MMILSVGEQLNSCRHFAPSCKAISSYEDMSSLFFSVCVLVAQLCLTVYDTVNCSLPGSSVHEILQGGLLE